MRFITDTNPHSGGNMLITITDGFIPGTVIRRSDAAGSTGADFLEKVFFATDKIMLSRIRKITGIDGSTLQNWTRRGWVENPVSKKYDADQLARILILNMLRDSMRLDRIVFLISYINGRLYDFNDSIVRDSVLYDCLCKTLDVPALDLDEKQGKLRRTVEAVTGRLKGLPSDTLERLKEAVETLAVTYCAAVIKHRADGMADRLINP